MSPVLAGCFPSRSDVTDVSFAEPVSNLTVGTSMALDSLDPAAGAPVLSLVAANLYQTPMRLTPGSSRLAPDAASCEFRDSVTYVCALVPGQAFSNGDPVTAQDLAASVRRAARRDSTQSFFDPLTEVVAAGNTVTFTLSKPDSTWPYVLATVPASILDHGTRLGSGPYELAGSPSADSIELVPNPHYGGSDHRDNAKVTIKHEADDAALFSDLTAGAVQVAVPGPSPSSIHDLRDVSGTVYAQGPADEVRVLAFNEDSMPGLGADHRLAIRQAVADTIDRGEIVAALYPGSAQPLPNDASHPDVDAAAATLQAAGVTTPVEATLTYNDDHLGDEELSGAVQSELDATGLFKIKRQAVPWQTFRAGVASGKYGVYLFGGSQGPRSAVFQSDPATDVPFVPIWQRGLTLVVRDTVTGVEAALAAPGVVTLWHLGVRGAE